MRYMGSKARFAAAILAVVLAGRLSGQTYVEPFIGGANIFHKVPGPKLGCDSNQFLVALWSAVSAGWTPPGAVSQVQYDEAHRQSLSAPVFRSLDDATIGFIGAGCSFGGKWFGGYARGGVNANGTPRDYAGESARAVAKQAAGLRHAQFVACSYEYLPVPHRSIVYCDPPYAGVTGYADTFNSAKFWSWALSMAEEGHAVFVSEYEAPPGWECVWSAPTPSSVSRRSRSDKHAVERLFRPA